MIGGLEAGTQGSISPLRTVHLQVPRSSSSPITSQFTACRPPRARLCGLSSRLASIVPVKLSGASLSSASGSQGVTESNIPSSMARVISVTWAKVWPLMEEQMDLLHLAVLEL